MLRVLRCLRRCFWVLWVAGTSMLEFAWLRLRGPLALPERARWLQCASRRLLPRLGVTYTAEGHIPARGLIVANHLSYYDILVFSAAAGASFVSKAEVRDWPLFGPLARLAGTVFVWRQSAHRSAQAAAELTACLCAGHPVTVFPEATTGDSLKLLPFRSTMFQAAIDAGVPVIPAAIGYAPLADGSVRMDICFWGDMSPVPHALKLFSKRRIECRVEFGPPLAASDNRKQLCRAAFEWISARFDEIETTEDTEDAEEIGSSGDRVIGPLKT
ncbi:MAG TPA: lysophospholipid acyltransferase family protein [Terriglobales bacterium]|jgi:1-acyl-sn-glycerol-3-phosphate acyltransferase|nr:lysophospholipid acyltransferase family protein [Terriglobales bacterium]